MQLSQREQMIFGIRDIQRIILDFFGWIHKRNIKYDRFVSILNKHLTHYHIAVDIRAQKILAAKTDMMMFLGGESRYYRQRRMIKKECASMRLHSSGHLVEPEICKWRPSRLARAGQSVPSNWRETERLEKNVWSIDFAGNPSFHLRKRIIVYKKGVFTSDKTCLNEHGLRATKANKQSIALERGFYNDNWHRLDPKTFYIFPHTRVVIVPDKGLIYVGSKYYQDLLKSGYREKLFKNAKKVQKWTKKKIKRNVKKIKKITGIKVPRAFAKIQMRIKDLGKIHKMAYTQDSPKLYASNRNELQFPNSLVPAVKFRRMSLSEHYASWFAREYACKTFGHKDILDPIICKRL